MGINKIIFNPIWRSPQSFLMQEKVPRFRKRLRNTGLQFYLFFVSIIIFTHFLMDIRNVTSRQLQTESTIESSRHFFASHPNQIVRFYCSKRGASQLTNHWHFFLGLEEEEEHKNNSKSVLACSMWATVHCWRRESDCLFRNQTPLRRQRSWG